MEHPTKEEALKELAEIFWNNDENWDYLENYFYCGPDDLAELNPTDHPIYYAAIAVDKLENYLETFYDFAEEAKWTRNYLVCKDCYDYISSEDANMVADVFTHYYGEEEGDIRFLDVSNCIENIEKDGKFLKEVPELLQEFSRNPCACCKSHLHGERFFILFEKKSGEL